MGSHEMEISRQRADTALDCGRQIGGGGVAGSPYYTRYASIAATMRGGPDSAVVSFRVAGRAHNIGDPSVPRRCVSTGAMERQMQAGLAQLLAQQHQPSH